jgi:hypothetical protein
LREDANVLSTSPHLPSTQVRRLALGMLLLAVPACGLSDYEARMSESQKREERFRLEQKYLGEPVQMPTHKNQEDREEPVANVFFRPPKGIEPKPKPGPRDNLWQYRARSAGNDFTGVDMEFAGDEKDFVDKVVSNYGPPEQASRSSREITPPGQDTPMVFDTWEFGSGPIGYSVNILRSSGKPIAIVYIYNKTRLDSVREAIKVSLQSLAIDQQVGATRQRYNQKSPWQLRSTPTR